MSSDETSLEAQDDPMPAELASQAVPPAPPAAEETTSEAAEETTSEAAEEAANEVAEETASEVAEETASEVVEPSLTEAEPSEMTRIGILPTESSSLSPQASVSDTSGEMAAAPESAAEPETETAPEASAGTVTSTTGMLIAIEPDSSTSSGELESKPAPDLSALWEEESSLTLGSVAASATATTLEPASGSSQTVTETPEPPAPKPAAPEVAETVAETPVAPATPAPAAPADAQIASTTPTAQPAGPAIRPEIATILQKNLKRLGFYDGEVDGSVGPKTRKALEDFQRSIGNPATGVLTDDEMFRLAQDADKVQSQ